ncbi:MAG: hypothetical protein ACOYXW_11170 [Actinomycetota bacterium]
MGTGVHFPEANVVLTPPAGEEETVYPLPAHRDGAQLVTCWELSAEEVAEIVRTRRVWLSLWVGAGPPPAFVTGHHDQVLDPRT